MTDMDILSQMIKDSALVQLGDNYGKPFVKLIESQAPDSLATINHLPADSIVIKADEFRSPNDVFKGEKGECKRADYVLISEEKNVLFILR